MAANDLDDDDYVAKLLKQDAKNATKRYDLVGLDAFNPKRSRSGAPKPNTNFLRHIIRQTDSHNAALLAKEAEESRARLKQMNKGKETEKKREYDRNSRRAAGRLTPPGLSDDDDDKRIKRGRTDNSEPEEDRESRRRRNRHVENRHLRSKWERDRSRDRQRHHERDEVNDEGYRRRSRHSRHNYDKERRHRYGSDEDDRSRRKVDSRRRHRRRSHCRSSSRSRSPLSDSRRDHKSSGRQHRLRSPRYRSKSPGIHGNSSKTSNSLNLSEQRSRSSASDSDPLEAIVGPLPPQAEPAVRSRGRGAHKANSMGMDSRFSSTYNPSADVCLHSDEEDWEDALEALKDRQRWKQQGAERLKAAGFTDEQVKKWEKGDEKNEDDVVWSMKGSAREWDRGKVVDDDGGVSLKAEWGRLK